MGRSGYVIEPSAASVANASGHTEAALGGAPDKGRRLRVATLVLLCVMLALMLRWWRTAGAADPVQAVAAFQRFSTVLVGIFIEAVPFLLLGVLVSSLVTTFVGTERLVALLPRSRLGAVGAASVLGTVFPICDCGLIPIARSLLRGGVPVYAALTFLLAAPVMNPIVLWSTWTAFGDRPGIVALRFVVALGVACTVGLLVSALGRRATLLRGAAVPPRFSGTGAAHAGVMSAMPTGILGRPGGALAESIGEFIEIGTFLTVGAAVAAGIQVLVPPSALLGVAGGPILSVAILMALRAMISVCAAVDAFLALAFAATFSPGALIAFMTIGPVFDLKNALMVGGTFGRGLLLLYLLVVTPLIFIAGVVINLLLPRL
jgi:uncharacterized membrane protein YraQ (UPF0718 family)